MAVENDSAALVQVLGFGLARTPLVASVAWACVRCADCLHSSGYNANYLEVRH
jgi:hypothetical protein